MIFEVTRASLYIDDDTRPCAEAERVGDVWTIEFQSLDGLWSFIQREGRVVIGTPYFGHGQPRLTIYDDYLE